MQMKVTVTLTDDAGKRVRTTAEEQITITDGDLMLWAGRLAARASIALADGEGLPVSDDVTPETMMAIATQMTLDLRLFLYKTTECLGLCSSHIENPTRESTWALQSHFSQAQAWYSKAMGVAGVFQEMQKHLPFITTEKWIETYAKAEGLLHEMNETWAALQRARAYNP